MTPLFASRSNTEPDVKISGVDNDDISLSTTDSAMSNQSSESDSNVDILDVESMIDLLGGDDDLSFSLSDTEDQESLTDYVDDLEDVHNEIDFQLESNVIADLPHTQRNCYSLLSFS